MKLNKSAGFLLILAYIGMMTSLLLSSATYADGLASFFSTTRSIPNFSLPTFDSSKDFSQKDLKSCASLVVFWASWCETCRQEHSFLKEIHDNYNVPIYGIDYVDNAQDASTFLSDQGNPYKLLAMDSNGKTADDFGIKVVPESFLVDKKGKILYHQVGPLNKEAWENNILPIIKSCVA